MPPDRIGVFLRKALSVSTASAVLVRYGIVEFNVPLDTI